MERVRVPPLLANVCQACYHCFKSQDEIVLQRCSGCRRISYCGSACQRADWSKHKGICKALKSIEANYGRELIFPYNMLAEDSGMFDDSKSVNECIERIAQVEMRALKNELERPLRIDERNLVGWEPHCLGCGRSELILRLGTSLRREPATSLKPCPDCKLSFYCSDEHWEAVKVAHQGVPCQDGRNNLSQCDMNKLCLQDGIFAQLMSGANAGEFKWAPERTKASWESIRGVDWTDFATDLKTAFGMMPENILETMLRGATEALSMPMTILWGLENLNSDDSWTKKATLNIHVLGAADKELENAQIFEEILHRLPHVKTLKLSLCGPELSGITGPRTMTTEMDTCPDCSRKGRKRIQIHRPWTYHGFMKAQESSYEKPDLAIAFDSGCSQEEVDSWKETIAVLIQHNIPTVFTAFNEEEARAEAEIFANAGATLHQELGPRRNPWGSLLSKIEPNKVIGFYAANGWLAGGFR